MIRFNVKTTSVIPGLHAVISGYIVAILERKRTIFLQKCQVGNKFWLQIVKKDYDQKAMNGVLFYFSIINLCLKQNVNKFIDPMKELANGKQYRLDS